MKNGRKTTIIGFITFSFFSFVDSQYVSCSPNVFCLFFKLKTDSEFFRIFIDNQIALTREKKLQRLVFIILRIIIIIRENSFFMKIYVEQLNEVLMFYNNGLFQINILPVFQYNDFQPPMFQVEATHVF